MQTVPVGGGEMQRGAHLLEAPPLLGFFCSFLAETRKGPAGGNKENIYEEKRTWRIG